MDGHVPHPQLQQYLTSEPALTWKGSGSSGCSDIVITAALEPEELAAFYSQAEVFVYPSLSEGFGLPPVEAMACGTPVVASHATSLPEVLGDGALYADPLDSQAFAQAMLLLLKDAVLRLDLCERGKRQAERYTAERMARHTLAVYQQTLQQTPD
jgi:glycosyltransferase involved in cell wall biosynthesis